jgi:hypothetical protein
VGRLSENGALRHAVLNLLQARAEVLRALGPTGHLPPAPDVDDAMDPELVPSVRHRGRGDRVLAEIDADGFAFAVLAEDVPFFNRREHKHPRQQHLIDVVIEGGRVCVRKRFRPPRAGAVRHGHVRLPVRELAIRSAYWALRIPFYSEVAALLRLAELPFVPKLRRVDVARRTLWMDFLLAESLRHVAAGSGKPVHDADLPADLAAASSDDLDRREAELLDASAQAGDWRAEVASMIRAINARGVAPLDIKLGNFLRGRSSGRLYWIDFERSRLSSQPSWLADLSVQDQILRDLYGITR